MADEVVVEAIVVDEITAVEEDTDSEDTVVDVAGVADIETTLECVDTAVERADEAEIGGV